MIQRLSSIKLTFFLLAGLVLSLGSGCFLSLAFKEEYQTMNETGLFEWLAHLWSVQPFLLVWFVVLCICAFILLVNALCCTLGRQLVLARKTGRLKNWCFFILHCFFIVVHSVL